MSSFIYVLIQISRQNFSILKYSHPKQGPNILLNMPRSLHLPFEGHEWVLQDLESEVDPIQCLPPCLGPLQLLDLLLVPPPQVLLQPPQLRQ